MDTTRLQPAGLVVSPAFSHVAVVPPGATTTYVGGQNGVDATGAIVSEDAAAQAVRAIDNTEVALAAAGASLADVVQWTVLIAADGTGMPASPWARRTITAAPRPPAASTSCTARPGA